MIYTRKFDFSAVPNGVNWADAAAEEIITLCPDTTRFTTAAGISPSGVVHFGNFRDIITSHLVREALLARGKNARLILAMWLKAVGNFSVIND